MAASGIVRIGPTYYRGGFFNETTKTPPFPRPEDLRDSRIELECEGPNSCVRLTASVKYVGRDGRGKPINRSGNARIFGGIKLARWFGENMAEGEDARVEVIDSLRRYRLSPIGSRRGTSPSLLATGASSPDRTGEMSSRNSPLVSPQEFENLARKMMEELLGVPLPAGSAPGIAKKFDFFAPDGSVAGDAKYFTMVRGTSIPPAKFSIIAEHVWLLEKTSARRKFLAFGNDRRVPEEWLKRHGAQARTVEFYFIDPSVRHVERLA